MFPLFVLVPRWLAALWGPVPHVVLGPGKLKELLWCSVVEEA